jgi:hypothetical protein
MPSAIFYNLLVSARAPIAAAGEPAADQSSAVAAAAAR